jgi:uncharacterized membrane protein
MGCNNSANNKQATDTPSTANAEKPAPVDPLALKATGIYYGYVPCADCEGIMTYLLLNPDLTYRLEETYYKKDDKVFLTNGSWKFDNGKIVLTEGDKIRQSYLAENGKLWQLDYEGNRISGNLGDKYVLNRQQKADNSSLKGKADAGIDFVAGGNEPFWSLDIDKGKSLTFNSPNIKTPISTPYAEPTITNGIREYTIETESTKLKLKISPQFCSDGMSDFIYEYKVDLELNKKKYSGCGRLLHEL